MADVERVCVFVCGGSRQGARGVVVSVLSYVDVKKLSAFEAMLGIHFRQAVMGNGPMR